MYIWSYPLLQSSELTIDGGICKINTYTAILVLWQSDVEKKNQTTNEQMRKKQTRFIAFIMLSALAGFESSFIALWIAMYKM